MFYLLEFLPHMIIFSDIIEDKMQGYSVSEEDGIIVWCNERERLWTVERFNLTQIKMETGQQVAKHVRKQQKTKERKKLADICHLIVHQL